MKKLLALLLLAPSISFASAIFNPGSGTGGGGGGSSSLAIATGTSAGFSNPPTSSPTAVINFNSSQFTSALKGGATAFISLDPSSVTLQGNSTFPAALLGNAILNQSTLQSGATFYVSSGTAYVLQTSTINLVPQNQSTRPAIISSTSTMIFQNTSGSGNGQFVFNNADGQEVRITGGTSFGGFYVFTDSGMRNGGMGVDDYDPTGVTSGRFAFSPDGFRLSSEIVSTKDGTRFTHGIRGPGFDISTTSTTISGSGGLTIRGGGIRETASTISGNFTFGSTSTVVIANCATACAVTLPTAVGVEGKIFRVKITGVGPTSITGTSSETIDGSLTVTPLPNQTAELNFRSNNVNWDIF